MRWIFRLLKYFSLIGLAVFASIAVFVNFAPTFGAAPSGAGLKRIQASKNYSDGRFYNLVETQLDTSSADNPRSISAFFSPPADKNPQSPLPSQVFLANELTPGQYVWLGHSTVLFNLDGVIILTDPVFHRASPVPFIGEPFAIQHETAIDQLPPIDIVLLSHDHYDHLDHLAVQALDKKVGTFLMPLGLGAHLQHWGVAANKIQEFDWYQQTRIADIQLTLTPSRHFSGRGVSNRFSTLWGSWVVQAPTTRVFFSGDSGYFDEFKKIGDSYGPFDLAFIENGAYNSTWAQVHMTPEQAVQSSIDLQAKAMFAIHWGKFDLALHRWDEPIERASAAAKEKNVELITSEVGEVFGLQQPPHNPWWRF